MDYNELKRQEEHRRRWIAYMEQGGKVDPQELWESKALADKIFLWRATCITMLFVVSALVLGIVLGAVGALVFTQDRAVQQGEMLR